MRLSQLGFIKFERDGSFDQPPVVELNFGAIGKY